MGLKHFFLTFWFGSSFFLSSASQGQDANQGGKVSPPKVFTEGHQKDYTPERLYKERTRRRPKRSDFSCLVTEPEGPHGRDIYFSGGAKEFRPKVFLR